MTNATAPPDGAARVAARDEWDAGDMGCGELVPTQNEGPVNALAKAHVEVDGKQHSDWTREFSYSEINRL